MGIEPYSSAVGSRWFIFYNIYVVDSTTPLKSACSRYVLNGTSWDWNQSFHNVTVTDKVPVPDGALRYDGGADHSMAIYQPSTRRYWEFFVGLDPAPAGTVDPQGRPCDFLFTGGGRILNVNTLRWGYPWPTYPQAWYTSSPGYFREDPPREDRSWGRPASALPAIGGLITPQEWNDAGHGEPIKHALSMVVRWAGVGKSDGSYCGKPVWPAYRHDCNADGLPRVVEGSRIRIDPSAECGGRGGDIAHERSYQLCRAMQTYGAYVTDQTGGGYGIRFRSGASLLERDATFDSNGGQQWPSTYYDWNRTAWSKLQVLAEPPHGEWRPNCYC